MSDDSNMDDKTIDYRYDARNGAPPPPPAPPYGTPPSPPAPPYVEHYAPPRHKPHKPSRVWLFICSCTMPGIGYMYLGLIKKGLFFLSAFFISIFLTATLSKFFALIIPVLYIATFFDGFRIRNAMENGEHVPDDVNGVLNFAGKYRVPLAVGFAFVAVYGVIDRLANLAGMYSRFQFMYNGGISGVISVALIAVLVYFLLFRNKPRKGRDDGNSEN